MHARRDSCAGPIKKVARLRGDIRLKRVQVTAAAEKRGLGRRMDRHLMGHCCDKMSPIVGGLPESAPAPRPPWYSISA